MTSPTNTQVGVSQIVNVLRGLDGTFLDVSMRLGVYQLHNITEGRPPHTNFPIPSSKTRHTTHTRTPHPTQSLNQSNLCGGELEDSFHLLKNPWWVRRGKIFHFWTSTIAIWALHGTHKSQILVISRILRDSFSKDDTISSFDKILSYIRHSTSK